MLKALLRYIIFQAPSFFLSGLSFILFDRAEIIQCSFNLRRQWRPNIKRQVLESYLNECYKQVNKEAEKDEKKRLDKD